MGTIDGTKVGEELKATHKAIYGNSQEINNVFAGGNVGVAFLGLCIQEGAKMVADSINVLARAIGSRPPAVTNNYYEQPKPTTKSGAKGKAKP